LLIERVDKEIPMKRSLILASLALAPALSAAQPASAKTVTYAPPAAPGEVSSVNGQLVPVGDQNRYRHAYKTWNLSTNPLGYTFGLYGVSVSRALHPHFALRADLGYFHETGGSERGFEVGLTAPIYFRRAYSGLFLEPGVLLRRTWNGGQGGGVGGVEGLDAEGTRTAMGPQVLIGYHWLWDGGLNAAVAIGAARNLNSSDGNDVVPAGYLRFGYAF
jgi:hypothetical protein